MHEKPLNYTSMVNYANGEWERRTVAKNDCSGSKRQNFANKVLFYGAENFFVHHRSLILR